MEKQLLNKNVVITGASSGIGESIAMKVAQRGGRPILLARSDEKLKAICKDIQQQTAVDCSYYRLDVSDFEQINDVFENILAEGKHIDILLNNAGFGVFDNFHEADFKDVSQMFNVNVLGLMACTKAVLPTMMKQNKGHIINIASQAGKLATPKSSGYSATKHAVLGFTNSLRMELVHTNISVSAVNPGPVETNFFSTADKTGDYVKSVKKYMLKSDDVSDKIIQLMIKPQRELNVPYWMNIGSKLHQLFPRTFERMTGKFLNKK